MKHRWLAVVYTAIMIVSVVFPAQVFGQKQIFLPVVIPGTENAPRCEDVPEEDRLIIKMNGAVVSSTDEAAIVASTTVSETYTVMGFTVAEGSLMGSAIAGTIEWRGKIVGTIVKNVPGSIVSKAVGGINAWALFDALYRKICEDNQKPLDIAATAMGNGAGMFYYTRSKPERARLVYSDDAVSVAANLANNEKVQLALIGSGTAGYVATLVPIGDQGLEEYPWEVVEMAMVQLVAEKSMDQKYAEEVIDYLDEWYRKEDNEQTNDPIWVPDPDQECPMIDVDYTVNRIMMHSALQLDEQIQYAHTRNDELLIAEMVEIYDAASAHLGTMSKAAFYATTRKRVGPDPHDGHVTTLSGDGDPEGFDYNWEVRCWWNPIRQTYNWTPRTDLGVFSSGLTSSRGTGLDFIFPEYDHRWSDMAPSQ